MFTVIRVSEDHDVVLVEDDSKVVYFYGGWKARVEGKTGFEVIAKDDALGYFSGHADGMGYGELPEEPFSSLEEVLRWREKMASLFCKECLAKHGIVNDYTDEERKEMSGHLALSMGSEEDFARRSPELMRKAIHYAERYCMRKDCGPEFLVKLKMLKERYMAEEDS